MRRVLQSDWQSSGTTDLYYLYSSGHVTQLFKDGEELTSVTDTPNANKEYNYNSSTGLLSLFLTNSSTTLLNSSVIEGGQDWEDLKLSAVKKASDMVRNVLPFPIYPRKGVGMESATGNNLPEIIVRCTSIIACSDLVRPFDFEKSEEILNKAINPEGTGFLDMLRKGEISLYSSESEQKYKGIIKVVSTNANTSGGIVDVKGVASTEWDAIKILISNGGTITAGSANSSVKYSTYTRNEQGLKLNQNMNEEVIDCGWQSAGHKMWIRFAQGVYTTNDEWELEVSGRLDQAFTTIKSVRVSRR